MIERGNQKSDMRSGQDWLTPGRFALLLALMIFIPFRQVLQGSQTFAVRDFGLFSYPVANYFRDSFWRGEWPLWNPLSCCGTPFLAQLNTLTLYPPSLIYLLLPLTWALPFFCLLHLFLAGLGMYFLALRWSGSRLGAAVAGTIFAFNGLSLNFLMWPSHIATYALMPWVIWLVQEACQHGGRRIILAALAAALQVLAGGPETILLTWLFLFALAALFIVKRTPAVSCPASATIGRAGSPLPAAAPDGGQRSARPTFPGIAVSNILPRLVLARRFFAVGCLALALSAAQILPFIDLSLHSNRGTQFGDSAWAMPPCGWANFLVPLFQTSSWQQIVQQEHQHWTSSYYAGIGAVFLALMALGRGRSWRVWLPGVALALSLILALGDQGGLFTLLRHLLPFLGLFRYPVKFVLIAVLALPLLAAAAIGQYENWQPLPLAMRQSRVVGRAVPCPPRDGSATLIPLHKLDGGQGTARPTLPDPSIADPPLPPRSWRPELACGLLLLVLIGLILWFARQWPAGDLPWPKIAANGLERAGFLMLIIALVCLLISRPSWRAWSGPAILAVCWLDVLTHEPWQNPTVNPSVFQPGLESLLQPGPVRAGESRILMSPYSARQMYYGSAPSLTDNFLLDRSVFLADCNLLDGVPKVDGFFSLYLRHIDKVLSLFDTNSEAKLGGLEDVMAVSQTIAPGKVFDWVPRPSFLPWVSAGQAPVFAGEEATLRALADPAVDFHKTIYLPLEARSFITAQRQESARVVVRQFRASKIVLQVETPAPAMVALSQAWYHNWKAGIDGRVAPLWRANEAFQAIEAPAGRHEITLVYRDLAFRWGACLSILGLLFCTAAFLFWHGNGRC
jgi:hypothetical protein